MLKRSSDSHLRSFYLYSTPDFESAPGTKKKHPTSHQPHLEFITRIGGINLRRLE